MKEQDEVVELLEDILGVEAADKYIKAFAGHSLYVPRRILAEQIYRSIREEFRDGASYLKLSIKYGYTQRSIRNIVHAKKR
jgi:Mor family transcriptional regulator